MRTPTSARIHEGIALRAVLLLALLGVGGCATLRSTVQGYETGPNGIARSQQELRQALIRQDYRTALGVSEDDALLAALNRGVAAYYAAQYRRSAAVLDSAALLADDRITKSVAAGALSLVTSDLALPYQARRTERLFIPYYAMLAYTRLEQWEDAAVEARRLSALLSQYAEDRSESERASHATLHWLAGSVFERAGEREEAKVAFRLARAVAPEMVNSTRSKPRGNEGDVVVVIERGFVAHRTTEAVNVFLGDSSGRHRGDWHESSGSVEVVGRSRDHDNGYWLSVAFPALRHSSRPHGEVALMIDGMPDTDVRAHAVLDDAVAGDEARERVALLARATARAATKYAVAKAVKDKKGETAGKIANYGASLLERADVRSWHLLPQDVTVLRAHVTSGTHNLTISVDGEPIDLGQVNVIPGAVVFATTRVWSETHKTYATRPPE